MLGLVSEQTSDVVDLYQEWRKSRGIAENTLKRDAYTLRQFVMSVGHLKVASLTAAHVDAFFLTRQTLSEPTQNGDLATLRTFFKFLDSRSYHRNASALLMDYRPIKYVTEPRRRVPVGEFPALLDAADRPRDRALVAVGLYTFLRAGELTSLRIRDVSLAEGQVTVVITKSKDSDVMPISRELDAELRTWFIDYSEKMDAPLQPDWLLLPGVNATDWKRNEAGVFTKEAREFKYHPGRPIGVPERVVKRVLSKHGWTDLNKEGCHTLRRSGARALYDELAASDGHTNAIETVSAMLHHKTFAMTQHYLGLTETRMKRDGLIRGRSMFPSLEEVTRLPGLPGLRDSSLG